MWKKFESSFCLKVFGKPYVLARIVLIMDIMKKIGARIVGSRIPRPPDDKLSDAMIHACVGKELASSKSCKKSCEDEVSDVVKGEVRGKVGEWDLASAESKCVACELMQYLKRVNLDWGSGTYFCISLMFFAIDSIVDCWKFSQKDILPMGAPRIHIPFVISDCSPNFCVSQRSVCCWSIGKKGNGEMLFVEVKNLHFWRLRFRPRGGPCFCMYSIVNRKSG